MSRECPADKRAHIERLALESGEQGIIIESARPDFTELLLRIVPCRSRRVATIPR